MVNFIAVILSFINILTMTKIIIPEANNANWSILIVVYGICIFFVIKHFFKNISRLKNIYFDIFSFLFSSMMISGYWIANKYTISGLEICIYLFGIAASFPVFFTLFYQLYLWIEKNVKKWRIGDKKKYDYRFVFFLYFSILICWFIILMAYYPGVFGYDSVYEALEVKEGKYTSHHPMLHTLMVGFFYILGERVLTYNIGIFLYSVTQIVILDAIITYALWYLYNKGLPRYITIVLMLFYAVFPVVSISAMDVTKDILFSGFMLWFVISLHQLYECNDTIINRKKFFYWIQVIISGWLMCSFRNNGIHAMCVSLFLAIVYLWREKKKCIVTIGVYILIIMMYLGSNHYILEKLNVYISAPREAMGIPFQQICRVYVNHYQELEPEMIERIEEVLPDASKYKYNLSDPIKSNSVVRNRVGYIMDIWTELLVKYPYTYIEAFLYANAGMWFIDDVSYSYVYVYDEDGIGEAIGAGTATGYGVESDSKLPLLKELMNRIIKTDFYLEIPIIGILFCPAFYFWIVLYFIMIACHKKYKSLACSGIILFGYHFTTLLGPCALLRYMYPLIICMPFVVGLTLLTIREKVYINCESNLGE